MTPNIIENHTEKNVNVLKIVQRIIRDLPTNVTEGLEEIVILDKNTEVDSFGCYKNRERRIELYLDGITLWQPWLLKKTYFFPYLSIGMVLGHEIDHHVNRNNSSIDREQSAEMNMMKYIYPSLGIFKPFTNILLLLFTKINRNG
jgi:hypothetical protein